MEARAGVRQVAPPEVRFTDTLLHRPSIRLERSVVRADLIERLVGSRTTPVLFVLAPAGYGKTTLLAQWTARDRRPFAWVTLEDHDDDPITLLGAVSRSLDEAGVLEPPAGDTASWPPATPADTQAELRAVLARLRRPVVVVLDDAHCLSHPDALALVEGLADGLPEGSQLAIGGRAWSIASLARRRATGSILELGPVELAMDRVEASELLRLTGVDPERHDVEALVSGTEGWPVGLYLAALSLKDRSGREPAAPVSGRDRFVADYLWFEFLSALPKDEIRFLERSSVLDRVSGPACDEVLERTGSGDILERLERENLLIVPLDHHRGWFRYHRLFRELLLGRIESRDPQELVRLRRRAAVWCEQTGDVEGAIGYAMAAEDAEHVAALVARSGPRFYAEGGAATVERWFAWLNARGSVELHPPVALLLGLLRATWGHPADAERWAETAARADHDAPAPDGSTWGSWLAVLRAMQCRDGVQTMETDAAIALEGLGPTSQFRAAAVLFAGLARYMLGDIDGADLCMEDAVELGHALGATLAVAGSLGERCAIAMERGDLAQAEVWANEALAYLEGAGLDEYPTNVLPYAVAARMAAHRGDVSGARVAIAKADRLRPFLTHAIPHVAVQGRLELARAHIALADPVAARMLLREILDILRHRPRLGTLVTQTDELSTQLDTMGTSAVGGSTLTSAELRLLPFLPGHLSFRQIGEELHLSQHTVKSQAISIYRKLGVTSRNEAVEQARILGLLTPEARIIRTG